MPLLQALASSMQAFDLSQQPQQFAWGSVALALMVIASWYRRRYASRMKRLGMPVMYRPPQGRAIPVLGQALNFLTHRPWDLIADWHAQYGPIVCFPLLGSNMYSVASPLLLRAVLQSKIACVKKDVQNVMKTFMVILGTGIVTSEDDAWMKQRLKMSQPLRNDVLEMIPRQTLVAVQRLMEEWDDAARRGEAVPVGSSLRHLTLQVISGTFLSLSAEESDSTFAKMYLPIVDESNARVWHPYRSYLFVLPAFWRQLYNVYRLNAYVSKLIRDRWRLRFAERSAPQQPARNADILDRVLDAYEKECGGTITPTIPDEQVRQLRDEMKTFMLAGHETSAAMMTWAIYELMGHSDLMELIEAEGRKVFGKRLPDAVEARPTDLPSFEQLSELILSEATLKVRPLLAGLDHASSCKILHPCFAFLRLVRNPYESKYGSNSVGNGPFMVVTCPSRSSTRFTDTASFQWWRGEPFKTCTWSMRKVGSTSSPKRAVSWSTSKRSTTTLCGGRSRLNSTPTASYETLRSNRTRSCRSLPAHATVSASTSPCWRAKW
jgi:cytochrome P450